ncbi:hypothetical protein HanPSC8_Chr15g0652361 [Helianthus annuus]|nr:hypothetical protein HanPSC8_Chr15g0652361 [Helianthus annuus]
MITVTTGRKRRTVRLCRNQRRMKTRRTASEKTIRLLSSKKTQRQQEIMSCLPPVQHFISFHFFHPSKNIFITTSFRSTSCNRG